MQVTPTKPHRKQLNHINHSFLAVEMMGLFLLDKNYKIQEVEPKQNNKGRPFDLIYRKNFAYLLAIREIPVNRERETCDRMLKYSEACILTRSE